MGGGKTKDDKDFLLMDNVKGDWAGDPTKNIDKSRQTEYNSLLKETTIVPKRVMVLKDEEGNVYYHDIGWDYASNTAYNNPDNPDDETDIINTSAQRVNETAQSKALDQQLDAEIKQYKSILNGNKKAASYIRAEINSPYVTSPKYADTGNRENLTKAFYMAAAQTKGDPNYYELGAQ